MIEPVVARAGYDLEDLSVSRAGRRHVVRVIVDADGGINLDAVAEVSRAVSTALDEAEEAGGDLVAGEYQLEVSSPGVDRPLTLPRHWRRNVGRLVKVTVRGAGVPGQRGEQPGGDRQVTGRVVGADEEQVVLETEAGPAGYGYPELGPGRVQVEFSRLADVVEFSDVERREVVSWAAPPSLDTATGRMSAPPGRGKVLLKMGNRPGVPINVKLTEAENTSGVNDTNKRWHHRGRGA